MFRCCNRKIMFISSAIQTAALILLQIMSHIIQLRLIQSKLMRFLLKLCDSTDADQVSIQFRRNM